MSSCIRERIEMVMEISKLSYLTMIKALKDFEIYICVENSYKINLLSHWLIISKMSKRNISWVYGYNISEMRQNISTNFVIEQCSSLVYCTKEVL